MSFRGRTTAFLLALAIEIVIALLLLWMAPHITPQEKPKPLIFGLDSATGAEAPAAKEAPTRERARKRAGDRRQQPEPQPQQPAAEMPPPPISPPETNGPHSFILMTRNEYAANDIARMPAKPAGDQGDTADSASGGNGAGDSARAGTGPQGQILYAADWYRRPGDAQLSPYISPRALGRDGWGEVACRTAARYRVEDCQELGEYPRGSGYAGSVRQAAFQFLIKPPRVNDQSMVGTWVRIRITYSTRRGGSGEGDEGG